MRARIAVRGEGSRIGHQRCNAGAGALLLLLLLLLLLPPAPRHVPPAATYLHRLVGVLGDRPPRQQPPGLIPADAGAEPDELTRAPATHLQWCVCL
jgi:hypothetical protein